MMYDLETKQEENELIGASYEIPKSVKLSQDLFEEYKENDRVQWSKQAVEDRAFVNSAQWETDDAEVVQSEGKPALAINVIKPGIERLVAHLTANQPRFTGIGKENSDVTIASHIGNLMTHIYDVSTGDIKVKYAVRDYEEIGMLCLMAYYDSNADWGKGELKFTDVDPLDVYIDPNSKDPLTRDATHKLIVRNYTGEQAQEIWGLSRQELATAKPCGSKDRPEHDRYKGVDQIEEITEAYKSNVYRVIDRYSKVLVDHFLVSDPITNFERLFNKEEYIEFGAKPAIILKTFDDIIYKTDEQEVKEFLEIHKKTPVYHSMVDPNTGQPTMVPGYEGEGAIPGSTVQIVVTTMTDLLTQGVLKYEKIKLTRIQRVLSIGDLLISDDTLPVSRHILITQMLHHRRNPYPMGDVRLIKGQQEYLNKIWSLIITNATNATNVKVIIGKNTANVEKLTKQWKAAGAQIIEVEMDLPGAEPKVIYPQQLSGELYRDKQLLEEQIEKILGSYTAQDGQMDAAPQTYKATVAIDEMGQRRTKAKREDIEDALDELGSVIMEWMPHIYTQKKVIRILAPNNEMEEVIFNDWDQESNKIVNDLTVGKYDVKVVSGSMLPTNRWAKKEYYMELWDRRILTDPAIILRESDIPNVDQIIQRADVINQQGQMIQQLQEEVKRLKGDMQTADRELRQADRQVVKEKFVSQVKGAEASLKANVELAKSKLKEASTNSKPKEKK